MSQPPNPELEAFPQFELPPALPPRQQKPPPVVQGRKRSLTMSYHNYLDAPQNGPQRQQGPPSQSSQNMAHANGMNGGGMAGVGNGLVGYPTPAGHQSDLNYVMSMVDELSSILRTNQQLTANVVDKMGKVRERAANSGMSNDEVIAAVAEEMNGMSRHATLPLTLAPCSSLVGTGTNFNFTEESKNLEKQNSELREALEKSEHNKNENWRLAIHGAQILGDISEKMHKYKEQHEKDTLAWHKNYRNQLAAEREENLNLRQQINDMKASANRANGHLRDLRKWHNDNDELQELKSQVQQYRLSSRYWKRMALPLLEDDDEEWSDDDDLIDPEEKKREQEKNEFAKMSAERSQMDD